VFVDGDDTLQGDGGKDLLNGGAGVDTIVFTGTQKTTVNLNKKGFQNTGEGKDKIIGVENVTSGNGADVLTGNKVANELTGNGGNYKLYGNAGADSLNGGLDNDTMFGGTGADTFVFKFSKDSSAKGSRADIIKDFEQGVDLIDLSDIDASTKLRGNNEFTFDGESSFGRSKQGDIYYKQFDKAGTANDYTMVFIDTDNDRGTEMSIKLIGLHDLTAFDFIL